MATRLGSDQALIAAIERARELVRRPLNMLIAEALAVALVAGAELRVAVGSDLLRDGSRDLGIGYLVLA